jgi:hypothetical protein
MKGKTNGEKERGYNKNGKKEHYRIIKLYKTKQMDTRYYR